MALPNIFTKEVSQDIVNRIEKLSPESQPDWGKMNVAQMLAHCNVTYDMANHPEKFSKPGAFKKWILKLMVKNVVVNEKPYAKNSRTAPDFLVAAEQDFADQRSKLTNAIQKVQQEGELAYEGKESHSFGSLTSQEWNNMFYKHLNHHLTQFGV